jgi:hypothetical protein
MTKEKQEFICKECNKIFKTIEETGEHAKKEKHWEFSIKNSKLRLGIV